MQGSAGCPRAGMRSGGMRRRPPHPRPPRSPSCTSAGRKPGRDQHQEARRGTRSSASASWPRRRRRRPGQAGSASTRGSAPARLPACNPAPAAAPSYPPSSLGSVSSGAGAAAAPVWANPGMVRTSLGNFRSHCLVLGTTEVGDVISGVSGMLGRWSRSQVRQHWSGGPSGLDLQSL